MEILDQVVGTTVLFALGLVLAWMGNRRFDAIDKRFDRVDRRFEAVEQSIAVQGSELRGEMATQGSELRTEIRALRADLTQIALAVGTQPARDTA